jgi:hypothetical protein
MIFTDEERCKANCCDVYKTAITHVKTLVRWIDIFALKYLRVNTYIKYIHTILLYGSVILASTNQIYRWNIHADVIRLRIWQKTRIAPRTICPV